MTAFPDKIAILRTQSSRGPYWQLFHTDPLHIGYKLTPFYPNDNSIQSIPTSIRNWKVPKYVTIFTHTDQQKIIKYWQLPMTLYIANEHFTVLNLEYVAWLPIPTTRIPFGLSNDVLRTYNQQVLETRDDEDGVRRRLFVDPHPRPPTPPRSRSISTESSESVQSVLSVVSVVPRRPPGGEHPLDFPPLPPSPPPSRGTPTNALPIPDLVGTLLIRDAIAGSDSCPITAVPFTELESLTATSCFHVFETEAIEAWLAEHPQCPVCRHRVVNKITKENKN